MIDPTASGSETSNDEGVFDRAGVDSRLDLALSEIRDEADGVQASFFGQEGNHLRIAESRVIQAADVIEAQVMVRVVHRGREANATTTDLSLQGLRSCARIALHRAKDTPAPATPIVLPEPSVVPPAPARALDSHTRHLDAPAKSTWLREAFLAHQSDGLALAGRFHTGTMTLAVRSTTGIATFHRGSWSDLALSALERPAGHGASAFRADCNAAIRRETLDSMQEEVRLECLRARDPVRIEPGAWDVILAPPAVVELLEWLGMIGFSSRAFDDGTSFMCGHLGERITGEAISLVDDASMPHGIGVPLPFDAEGLPKRRTSLIDAGIAKGIVYDSRTARAHGCSSTGHARLHDDLPGEGARPAHLQLEPGTASLDDLIASVRRGLLVTRLHYVNGLLDPRRAMMTGLLRDAVFLIEDGRLGRAVQPLRFTDSVLDAFGRIAGPAGISRVTKAHNGWFRTHTCSVAPYLLIPNLRFTSGR